MAIELSRTHVKMDKPIAVGMSILDISKITMYSFLYDHLKALYREDCVLGYSDTDSFLLDITTDDFYRDMCKNISFFDTSDYPQPNEYNIPNANKKIPGKFKDELNGKIITEFVGLRAKCYAVRSLDDEPYNKKDRKKPTEAKKRKATLCGKYYNDEMKKSKGVKKNVVSQKITFDDYVRCVYDKCEIRAMQNTIRSIKHNDSIKQNKVALNPSDDKRYLDKTDPVKTYAWGHFIIDILEENMTQQQ